MTRGKYAARAANTVVQSLSDKVGALERQLAEERAAAAGREKELREQIRVLAADMMRQASALAEERVAEANAKVSAEGARRQAAEESAKERHDKYEKDLDKIHGWLRKRYGLSGVEAMELYCEIVGMDFSANRRLATQVNLAHVADDGVAHKLEALRSSRRRLDSLREEWGREDSSQSR